MALCATKYTSVCHLFDYLLSQGCAKCWSVVEVLHSILDAGRPCLKCGIEEAEIILRKLLDPKLAVQRIVEMHETSVDMQNTLCHIDPRPNTSIMAHEQLAIPHGNPLHC